MRYLSNNMCFYQGTIAAHAAASKQGKNYAHFRTHVRYVARKTTKDKRYHDISISSVILEVHL
jgi:hypothetical protein